MSMERIGGVVALTALVAFGASCATMVSGSTQKVHLTSNPSGATVSAEPGGHRAVTPGTLALKRKDSPYRLTFAIDGYEPYSVTLTSGTNGWVFGNLVLGGLIGIIVDSSTGAATKLSPGVVHANLLRNGIPPQTSVNDATYVFASNGKLLGVLALE